MMCGAPLVSICVPLYNAKEFISATIDSVIRQTYTNWEMIIVDDHSVDGSWDIVSAYRDLRIRCIRNEKQLGGGANWNRVLSEARGEYVKLLCHDDLLGPDCLNRQVEAFRLDSNCSVSLVSCARDIIDQFGRPLMRRQWFRRDTFLDGKSAVRATLRAGTNMIGEPSATLFRKEDARCAGLFDATLPYVTDLDYWLRLLAVGDLYYLTDNLCSFRISPKSWSSQLVSYQSTQFCSLLMREWRRGDCGLTACDVFFGYILCGLNGLARRMWFSTQA